MAKRNFSSPAIPSPDPQIIDAGSDLDAAFFFEENKGKIVAFVVSVLLALAAVVLYQHEQKSTRLEAAVAFTSAKTVEEWQAIVTKYPGSVVAGNSQLLVADKLRDSHKLDEAIAVLENFTKNTSHPLIAQGWMSYAATLELKGDSEKAAQTYANIAGQYSSSDAAPAAMSAQARLAKKSGDLKKAREIYENIVQRFPASYSSQEAQQEIEKLPVATP